MEALAGGESAVAVLHPELVLRVQTEEDLHLDNDNRLLINDIRIEISQCFVAMYILGESAATKKTHLQEYHFVHQDGVDE